LTQEASGPPILALRDVLLTEVDAADFPHTVLRYRNDRAASEVGLDGLSDDDWVKHFGRFATLEGNLLAPMAMAYHGHQFRHYNPDIGDGRGFLFAQLRDQRRRLMDLGTKGSGQTPFSRSGDGRLTLKGAVREILATEMLEALGVPTSRTLSVIETGERLMRNDEPSPTRSAVMVRLNHSHIRFGSFQRLAALEDREGLTRLLSYSTRHFYSDVAEDDPVGFLIAVSKSMAVQAARIMAAGFVHGVLNTDNMNITGEVFDFGPWRFVPQVDPGFVAAYFDQTGLYAYGRQAEAIYWNVAALADALRPLAEKEPLKEALQVFPKAYAASFGEAIFRRLGLEGGSTEEQQALASDLFVFMHEAKLPFEQAFFDLFGGLAGRDKRNRSDDASVYGGSDVIERLDAETPLRPERLSHEVFQKAPPTLLIDEVEASWEPIAADDDWQPFHKKVADIRAYGEALALSAKL